MVRHGAGVVGSKRLEALGKVTSDLRVLLAANPDQMSTTATAEASACRTSCER
jgi:hypothetical protein